MRRSLFLSICLVLFVAGAAAAQLPLARGAAPGAGGRPGGVGAYYADIVSRDL